MANEPQKKLSFTGDINGLLLKTIGSLAALGTFIPVFFNGSHQMLGLPTWDSYITFVVLYFILPLVVVLIIYRPQRKKRSLIRLLNARNAGNPAAAEKSSDKYKYGVLYAIAVIGSVYVLHPWLPIHPRFCAYACGILAVACFIGAFNYRRKSGLGSKLFFNDVEYGLLTIVLLVLSTIYFCNLSKRGLLVEYKKPASNEFVVYDVYQKMRDISAQLDLIKSSGDKKSPKRSEGTVVEASIKRGDSLQSEYTRALDSCRQSACDTPKMTGLKNALANIAIRRRAALHSEYKKLDSALGTVMYQKNWHGLRDSTENKMIRIQIAIGQLDDLIAVSSSVRESNVAHWINSSFHKKINLTNRFNVDREDLKYLDAYENENLRNIKSDILDTSKNQIQDSIQALTSIIKSDAELIRMDLSRNWNVFSNHMYIKGLLWFILLLFFAFSNWYMIRCDLKIAEIKASLTSGQSVPKDQMPPFDEKQQSGVKETDEQKELGTEGTVFKSFILVLAMLLVPIFKQITDKPADLDKPFLNFNLGDVTGIPALSSSNSTGRTTSYGDGPNTTTINYQIIEQNPNPSTAGLTLKEMESLITPISQTVTSIYLIDNELKNDIKQTVENINAAQIKIKAAQIKIDSARREINAVRKQMRDPGDR